MEMLAVVFNRILNESITLSLVAVAVILIRFLLKKAPRKYSYMLWGIVLLRLLMPFSIEADFGVIPDVNIFEVTEVKAPVQEENILVVVSENGEYELLDNASELVVADEAMTTDSKGMTVTGYKILPVCWIAGCIIIVMFLVVNYANLRRKVSGSHSSEPVGNNIEVFTIKEITVPFSFGILKPAIYIPSCIEEKQKLFVITHELVHIARFDYIIKIAAILLISVHWFNPVLWLAYYLMIQDMEVSCDEAAIKQIGYECKKEYAMTLLMLSAKQERNVAGAIFFGNNSTKTRIRHSVKLKGSRKFISAMSMMIVAAAAVFLVISPTTAEAGKRKIAGTADEKSEVENVINNEAELQADIADDSKSELENDYPIISKAYEFDDELLNKLEALDNGEKVEGMQYIGATENFTLYHMGEKEFIVKVPGGELIYAKVGLPIEFNEDVDMSLFKKMHEDNYDTLLQYDAQVVYGPGSYLIDADYDMDGVRSLLIAVLDSKGFSMFRVDYYNNQWVVFKRILRGM